MRVEEEKPKKMEFSFKATETKLRRGKASFEYFET
jgi:hypothetical protein